MSWVMSVTGDAESKKAEAEALRASVDFVKTTGAAGAFSFSGQHFQIVASAPEDAVLKAESVLEEYGAEADVDDQVEEDDEG